MNTEIQIACLLGDNTNTEVECLQAFFLDELA